MRQHSVEVDAVVSEDCSCRLRETAGTACSTALLLRVHHRARALLGLILNYVSWRQCDTFSSCSWTALTAVWVSLDVLHIISPSSASISNRLNPLMFRSASPFV